MSLRLTVLGPPWPVESYLLRGGPSRPTVTTHRELRVSIPAVKYKNNCTPLHRYRYRHVLAAALIRHWNARILFTLPFIEVHIWPVYLPASGYGGPREPESSVGALQGIGGMFTNTLHVT